MADKAKKESKGSDQKVKKDKLFGVLEEKVYKYREFTGVVEKITSTSFFLLHKKKKSKHFLKRIIPFSKLHSFEGKLKVGETITCKLKYSLECNSEKGELVDVREGFVSIINKKGTVYSVHEDFCDFSSEPVVKTVKTKKGSTK